VIDDYVADELHVDVLAMAAASGARVIVGVLDDDEVERLAGRPPLLDVVERALSVIACKVTPTPARRRLHRNAGERSARRRSPTRAQAARTVHRAELEQAAQGSRAELSAAGEEKTHKLHLCIYLWYTDNPKCTILGACGD